MARALAGERRGAKESDYAAEFESPALLTLGILYDGNRRFSGGAYLPLLRKVDRFASVALGSSLRSREGYAARIAEIDERVGAIVERLKSRGFRSPYLRAYVVARVNPVRWVREAERRKAGDAARRGFDSHGSEHSGFRRHLGEAECDLAMVAARRAA